MLRDRLTLTLGKFNIINTSGLFLMLLYMVITDRRYFYKYLLLTSLWMMLEFRNRT